MYELRSYEQTDGPLLRQKGELEAQKKNTTQVLLRERQSHIWSPHRCPHSTLTAWQGGGTYFWRSTAFASPSAEQLYSRSPTRRRPPTRPVGQGRGQKCAGRRAHPSGRGDPGGDAKTHSTQNTGIPTNSYGSPLIRFDFAQRKFVEFCENLKNSTKMIV